MSTQTNSLANRSQNELEEFLDAERTAYQTLQQRGLTLDLTRGKPSAEQLDLCEAMLELPTGHSTVGGIDVRNYGGLQGLPELRAIFAELLGVDADQLIAGGNSSLTMMHDTLVDLLLHGGPDSPRPWGREERVRFICPVPGYDRHFTMLAHHGIDMVPVPMNADGPDVAAVRELVGDPSVKGMWLVPTYANPTGAVCSLEVASDLVSMDCAAPDFRIFWDNAYAVHHLTADHTKTPDVLALASASGHANRPILFASTSKITFAGAGVAFMGASRDNVSWYLDHLQFASIGPDKVNQLRHVQFFESAQGVRDHMERHREILEPKFAAVDAALDEGLSGLDIAQWSRPTGGYFVNLDVLDGTAARVVALAKDAGIVLTPAGAAFPYGSDPHDRNLRLAPTFPVLADVEAAMAGVATCVRLAAAEKLVGV